MIEVLRDNLMNLFAHGVSHGLGLKVPLRPALLLFHQHRGRTGWDLQRPGACDGLGLFRRRY